MASNATSHRDGDGNSSDWIEIHNPTSEVVDLAGWRLTDDVGNLEKWTFPNQSQSVLDPGEYLVVFASGQSTETYIDAGGNLHTDFKLRAGGEYLGLVSPTGSVVHEFAPQYPQQLTDISYGIALDGASAELISTEAAVEVLLPEDGSLGTEWTSLSFQPDSEWITETSPGVTATTGVGFDSSTPVPNLVAHWPLDDPSGTTGIGSVADLAGSSHDGTPSGALTFGTAGAHGNTGTSVSLSNGSIDIPAAPELRPDSFTFMVWVKPDSRSGYQSVVTSRHDAGNPNYGFVLYNDSAGKWSFWTGNGVSAGWEILSGPSATTGVWQHLAISFDATTGQKRLWVDGILEATSVNQGYGPNLVRDLHIGGGGDFGTQYRFDGAIDDAMLFNQALNQSTIQSIMTNSLSGASSYSFAPLINTDIGARMEGVGTSAYLRIPFWVSDVSAFDTLQLKMQYDDGFVAYLNGNQVAVRNAPASPAWNDTASAPRPDALGSVFEQIDMHSALAFLQTGENVLAIHGLSSGLDDVDMLIRPKLVAAVTAGLSGDMGYFVAPTPGAANPTMVDALGPHVDDVVHSPTTPLPTDPLVVTANVTPSFFAVDSVTLHYRAMYGSESTLVMRDDGLGGDLLAGDGVYSATIPASAADAGEMLRYYITADDDDGNTMRAPAVVDVTGNSQDPKYFGTVVANPAINTALPVWQWFTDNVTDSHNRTGARASVYFNEQFYDNLYVRQRGQATNSSTSQKFDFNNGDSLYVDPDVGSVAEVNINGNGADQSYLRQVLAFDAFEQAGNPGSESFLTFMTLNGSFDRIGTWIEQVDENLIDRSGLDDTGELYKFVQRNNLDPVFTDGVTDGTHGPNSGISTGIERKTGDTGDVSSVADFIAGLHRSTVSARQAYLLDHANIPNLINYFAVRALIRDADDIRKNFYMYLDSGDTHEWYLLPWDKDFTFGVNGDGGSQLQHPFFGELDHPKTSPLQWNVLADVLFEAPILQEMYTRRLRTLMDELLLPPGSPAGTSWIEQHAAMLSSTAEAHLSSSANSAKSGIVSYVSERRNQLYGIYGPDGSEPILPTAQIAAPSLTIGAIEFNPASGNQDEEYVQVWNPNAFAVDISGWTVEGAFEHTFPAGTVIPANKPLYLSPSSPAFRTRDASPTGNEGLFVQQWDSGHLSSFGETITIRREDGSMVATKSYVGAPSPTQQFLRITEVHYHPLEPSSSEIAAGFTDADQFEFIEFINTSTDSLDLNGVHFSPSGGGVAFSFGASSTLASGQRGVIVSDLAAFTQRYGSLINVFGEYLGRAANGGETIDLEDATNSTITKFRYEDGSDPTDPDEADWPTTPDGMGPSLTVVDVDGDYNDGTNWVASFRINGTPGGSNLPVGPGDYNADGTVNLPDYELWKATFNSTTDLRADGNGNQIVDAADFVYWRDRYEIPVAAANLEVTFAPEDVNLDGVISPLDALWIINWLNAPQASYRSLDSTNAMLDVNSDGQIAPIDALRVINRLNALNRNHQTTLLSIDAVFSEDENEDDEELEDAE